MEAHLRNSCLITEDLGRSSGQAAHPARSTTELRLTSRATIAWLQVYSQLSGNQLLILFSVVVVVIAQAADRVQVRGNCEPFFQIASRLL